jgi:hypothetical protein
MHKYIYLGKNHYHIKKEILWMGIAFFFNLCLFVNVSWSTNMKPYGHWKIVSYIFYIQYYIQSSSSNYWIKMNFEFQNVVIKFFKCLLMFTIIKGCHQDFSLLCIILFVIHHYFFSKKWLTFNVFSFVKDFEKKKKMYWK